MREGPPITPQVSFSAEAVGWNRLVELHHLVDGQLDRALRRGCGIGFSELLALQACAATPDGEMRMNDLSDAVGLNQSSVTRLVSRLERANLLERRMCELDRRGVYTGLTPHGLRTLKRAMAVFEDTLQQALSRLAGEPRFAELIKAVRSV